MGIRSNYIRHKLVDLNTMESNIEMVGPDFNGKCPKCHESLILVEYELTSPHHWDGPSEYACSRSYPTEGSADALCDYRIGRFCGLQLLPTEIEPMGCMGETHPKQ